MDSCCVIPKTIKGEKFIYLSMAYQLAKENGGSIEIGDDNNFIGGQNFYRHFTIVDSTLIESKNTAKGGDLSRYFKIIKGKHKLHITELIDKNGDNHSNSWRH